MMGAKTRRAPLQLVVVTASDADRWPVISYEFDRLDDSG
jgi:hypothetical protein